MTALFVSELNRHWEQLGLAHAAGATTAEIAAFEQRHGVTLSRDLREYVTKVLLISI
jgi:hypothetical protein